MTGFVVRCSLVALLLFTVCTAEAASDVDVSGEVRVRAEVDKKDFDPAVATRQYTDLRTRLTLATVIEGNTDATVQLQDSRRFGGQDASGVDLSGTLNNGRNVDVHQAYVRIRRLWREGLGLQAGRFEVNLGNQRVFGSVGWHNVGRSWDGGSLFWEASDLELTAYWLRRRELNDPAGNRDFDVYGIVAKSQARGAEAFLFWEHDADVIATQDTISHDTGIDALSRASAGVYIRRVVNATDFEFNGVYQFGDRRASRFGSAGDVAYFEQNIAAYLITFEVGQTLDPDLGARIALGIDYASGDGDPDGGDHEAYDNLYYTGHKFRGFMDHFLDSNIDGLLDIAARGRVSPVPGWLLGADLHRFRTAAEYVWREVDGAAEKTKRVGFEIDLFARTETVPGAEIQIGASLFLPEEEFAGANADPGFWSYAMLTARF